jgi:predicted metal-dependent hydrolase
LADDLDGFFRNRSLKFMLAYADGFESLGAVQGGLWFGKMDHLLEGADENAIALWKWHMAEEFEHREVCFRIYHALYSRGLWGKIWNGYFYRIYGCVYAMMHLQGYMGRMFQYLIDQDRAHMSEAAKVQLDADVKALKKFQLGVFFPQLLKNFLPWYNPGRKPTPVGLFEYLRQYEKGAQTRELNEGRRRFALRPPSFRSGLCDQVPQYIFNHLAGGIHGQFVQESDAARHLVIGKVGLAPGNDLLCGDG